MAETSIKSRGSWYGIKRFMRWSLEGVGGDFIEDWGLDMRSHWFLNTSAQFQVPTNVWPEAQLAVKPKIGNVDARSTGGIKEQEKRSCFLSASMDSSVLVPQKMMHSILGKIWPNYYFCKNYCIAYESALLVLSNFISSALSLHHEWFKSMSKGMAYVLRDLAWL